MQEKWSFLKKYTHTPYGVSKEKPQGVTRFRTIKIEHRAECSVIPKTRSFFFFFVLKRMRIFFEIRFGGTERWSEEMQQNCIFRCAEGVPHQSRFPE